MPNVTIGGRTYDVSVDGSTVTVDGHPFEVAVRDEGEHTLVKAGGVSYRVQLPSDAERASGMPVSVDYRPFTLEFEGSLSERPARSAAAPARKAAPARRQAAPAAKGAITAKLAGTVLRVNVKEDQTVAAGEVLLVLEAMKMENEIKAGAAGIVKEVAVAEGDRVTDGQVLVVIE